MVTKSQENASGKLSESDLQSMHDRADVITYAVLAEVQHFELHRITNFRDYMTQYLRGQIEFYKRVSDRPSPLEFSLLAVVKASKQVKILTCFHHNRVM